MKACHSKVSWRKVDRHTRRGPHRDIGSSFFYALPWLWHALTIHQPVAKRIAHAIGAKDFNILQNNGRIAHQVVDHVHFHMIPKPNDTEGLGVGWPAKDTDMEGLKKYFEEIKAKI